MVTGCGRICFRGTQGQPQSSLRRAEPRRDQVARHIWLVTFMHYDVGYFDDERVG
jgi:hypothetical protein